LPAVNVGVLPLSPSSVFVEGVFKTLLDELAVSSFGFSGLARP